jgi:hypothetical protein
MAEMPGDGGAAGLSEWVMPPPMIGGHVTGPVVIGRSGGLVVAVRQGFAFPAGVEVEVAAHVRGSAGGTASVAAGLPGTRRYASGSGSPTGVGHPRTTRPGCAAGAGLC